MSELSEGCTEVQGLANGLTTPPAPAEQLADVMTRLDGLERHSETRCSRRFGSDVRRKTSFGGSIGGFEVAAAAVPSHFGSIGEGDLRDPCEDGGASSARLEMSKSVGFA